MQINEKKKNLMITKIIFIFVCLENGITYKYIFLFLTIKFSIFPQEYFLSINQ